MTNDELIECAESVLNFLVNSDKEFSTLKHFRTPSYINMFKIFQPHNITTMVEFTKILNQNLHILNEPLWVNSPQEFFHDDNKCIKFYEKSIKILLRKKKITKLRNKNLYYDFK